MTVRQLLELLEKFDMDDKVILSEFTSSWCYEPVQRGAISVITKDSTKDSTTTVDVIPVSFIDL